VMVTRQGTVPLLKGNVVASQTSPSSVVGKLKFRSEVGVDLHRYSWRRGHRQVRNKEEGKFVKIPQRQPRQIV
jgi:hypothetical protein